MKNNDTYRNSGLDRAKPKHTFHSFINKTFKRHKADTTGLVEDGTSSTTVVRIIVGLILVHLIVIGGVLLRGHMVKSETGAVATTAITPPPAPPAQAEIFQPAPATQPAVTTPSRTHITQTGGEMIAEDPADAAPAQPAAPAQAAPAPANTVYITHRIATGDTLTKIARQYGVTVDDIRRANPAYGNVLKPGDNLQIPVAANSDAARSHATRAAATTAPAPKIYIVQRGDTPSRIAKKHHITLKKLYELNGMSDKNNTIRPGQKLIVGE